VKLRRQLPAYSPLPLRAVLAGAGGLTIGAGKSRGLVESGLIRHYGGEEVLLTDSGTGALTLAIAGSLAGREGAPVALPAYGCYDLATAADGAHAPVLLYDLDPATLAPDPASLRAVLERGARAVVLAHWYGMPADPDPVRAEAERVGAVLIEDAAQGAGATLRGRPVGSFGDLTVLSFGRGKGTTAGRGGALLRHGPAGVSALARAPRFVLAATRGLGEYAQLKAQWLLGRPGLYALPSALPFLRLGETIYHAPAPVRAMSAVAARALTVTVPLAEGEAEVRRRNAGRLLASRVRALAPVAVAEGSVPGYLRLPLLAAPSARDARLTAAARALGIMPGYPRALCDLEGFGERVVNRLDPFPGARALGGRLVTLPTHGLLGERDLARLEEWLAAA
jgi:DegT/DnrJ/EryC1/StrS aminotransferase family protein